MRASCSTRSKRFHCGFSASRSVPSTSAQRVSGCLRWSHSSRSTVRPSPDSCSARETLARGRSAARRSRSATRCSYGATRGLSRGCWSTGTNQSSSTGSVASTYAAASKCPTWGGSKLPPNSAISGIEEEPLPIARERGPLRLPGGADLLDGCALLHHGAEDRAAGEQIDRGLVLDELVLLGAPAELLRVLGARMHHRRHAQPDGVEAPRVGQVDLNAMAPLAFVFVPGGGERHGTEPDAFERFLGQVVRQPLRVEPGRAEQLEGTGGAAGLGEVGALAGTCLDTRSPCPAWACSATASPRAGGSLRTSSRGATPARARRADRSRSSR